MSLNKILASFSKTVKQLEKVISNNAYRVEENDRVIDSLEGSIKNKNRDSIALISEAEKARAIADNIKTLIGQK